MLPKNFKPLPGTNRMRNEGGLSEARLEFCSRSNPNLDHLLSYRLSWISKFVNPNMLGVEFGAGIGVLKFYHPNLNILSTDLGQSDWLDLGAVDATASGFEDDTFDYIVVNQVLHHLRRPDLFFAEAKRILRPGGLVLIQDPYTSFFLKLALILMRHEGYDDRINLNKVGVSFCDSDDAWSANCSTARILFEQKLGLDFYPGFHMVHSKKTEFFTFLNSGGVTAKTNYIPLPKFGLKALSILDTLVCSMLPKVFALQYRVVLKKC